MYNTIVNYIKVLYQRDGIDRVIQQMKENTKNHHPDALAAAAEERRLQLEAALQFDVNEYEVGDHINWCAPHDGVEGRGELVAIGERLQQHDEALQTKHRWRGSQHVQVIITECWVWQPKRKKWFAEIDPTPVPEKYAVGRCTELKKHQITGRDRRKVA